MLEKNEYPVTFTKKDGTELTKLIGNKRVVEYQLVNSLSRIDRNTGKRIFKRSHRIESAYVGYDNNGNTEEFRYFQNKSGKGKDGLISYMPEFLAFENGGKIKINLGENRSENRDLFHFLNNHPRRANNKNGDGSRRPLFYLVDNNAEAIEYAQNKRATSEMDKFLWSGDQIEEGLARTIAKALRIEEVDEMNDAATRKAIEIQCKKNPNRFLNFLNQEEDTNMRADIQTASELSILRYDNKKYEWFLYDADSENEAKLCRIRSADDPTSALVVYFKMEDDNEDLARVRELIKTESKKKKK